MRIFTLTRLRFLPLVLAVQGALMAGQDPIPPPPKEETVQELEPPEEDLTKAEKQVYVLNPLQAAKEIRIGNFYLKKGSHRAAARRFEEAARWDPGSSEAWLRLGDARAKLGESKAASEAWTKYLELEPEGKQAAAVRKKLGKS